MQAETIAVQAGPRPFEDEAVLAAVREGLLSMRALRFRYEGGSTPGRVREVTPYGVLFGRANYLVAAEGEGGARNWRLDRLHEVTMTDHPANRAPGFSLQDYADESFGIYQDDTEDVVLRILPASAEGALSAGASTPIRTLNSSPTARSSSASGRAACASWPGICSPGAIRSRCSAPPGSRICSSNRSNWRAARIRPELS